MPGEFYKSTLNNKIKESEIQQSKEVLNDKIIALQKQIGDLANTINAKDMVISELREVIKDISKKV